MIGVRTISKIINEKREESKRDLFQNEKKKEKKKKKDKGKAKKKKTNRMKRKLNGPILVSRTGDVG